MQHFKRKPSVRSERREPIVAEDVLRAVLCESRTEAEIESMTGGTRGEVARSLELLQARGLVKKTEAGYVPAQILRRVG
jgi:CRP-like cAMP-binding protein